MTPGMCKVLVVLSAFAVDAIGKVANRAEQRQGIEISVPGRIFRSVSPPNYVAGFLPSDGGAKQLSQRGNAELVFRSGAVSLNGCQTQIQIRDPERGYVAMVMMAEDFGTFLEDENDFSYEKWSGA